MPTVKIVELIGISTRSFDDAVNEALERATKTLRGISGLDVLSHKAVVRDNKIVEYRVVVKIAFALEQ
jgi:flavin-binding protein dodecin